MSLDRIIPKPGDQNAVAFWEWVMTVGPPAACVLPLAVSWLFGGFVDFQWINQPVTLLQSFAILGAMCFPFAAFFAARNQWNVSRARASVTWPTAPGMVETSKIERRLTKNGTLYRLALTYGYRVDGNSYEGDTVEFGPPRVRAEELIEGLAKKYPAGAKVAVHYDPDDPATSVLETSDEMAWQDQWRIWLLVAAPFLISIFVSIKNSLP